MSNFAEKVQGLNKELSGSLAVLLVDSDSGLVLSSAGNGVNLDELSTGMTAFTTSFNTVLSAMGNGAINETVFTVGEQFHAMHRVSAHPSLYILAIVASSRSNLATVRAGVRRTAESVRAYDMNQVLVAS